MRFRVNRLLVRRLVLPMGRRLACGILALLALAGCIARDPVTGDRQISLISEETEIRIGRNAAPHFIEEGGGEFHVASVREYVSRVGHRVAAVSHRPDLPYEFHVLNTEGVNAFALPGGFIFITRGMLAQMENEAQLAAVLGHEVGHACARHGVERMQAALGLQLLLTAGAAIYYEDRGEPPPEGAVAIAQVTSFLALMKFSRDDESESDKIGMRYMVAAGYDPREMASMFEILKRARGEGPHLPEWASTHPDPENRVRRSEERIVEEFSGINLDGLTIGSFEYRRAMASIREGADAFTAFDRGRRLHAEGNHAAAEREYAEAIRAFPNEPSFRLARARLYLDWNRPADAVPDLRAAGDGFEASLLHARTALALGNLDEAENVARRAQRRRASHPGPYLVRAEAAEGRGDKAGAIDLYRRVLALADSGPDADRARARLTALGVR